MGVVSCTVSWYKGLASEHLERICYNREKYTLTSYLIADFQLLAIEYCVAPARIISSVPHCKM